MQTVTGPVWLLAVLGVLAVCGFVAVCWVAAGWAERAADWWHARKALADEDEGDFYEDAVLAEWEQSLLAELPPERTWEQMTSHQLPLAERRELLYGDGPGGIPSTSANWPTHEFQVVGHGNLGPQRERRPPWWEAEHRAAYESLGFDYPSGLMARVRELAP